MSGYTNIVSTNILYTNILIYYIPIQVTRVSLSVAHRSLLENRLICLGTAITRVAKTVLVGVVDKYCYAHPSALQVLVYQALSY